MQEGTEILRRHKMKVTPQRACIYAVLRQAGHLTADDIFQRVRKKMPSVSLGTVYSNLGMMREEGLIQEIKISHDKAIFDITTEEHYHFLCRKCKNIFDLDLGDDMPKFRDRKISGCLIDDFHGYFYGTCSKCLAQKGA